MNSENSRDPFPISYTVSRTGSRTGARRVTNIVRLNFNEREEEEGEELSRNRGAYFLLSAIAEFAKLSEPGPS